MGRRELLYGETDYPRAYRVVVKGRSWTSVHGPYATISAAKGKATRERRSWPKAEVHIEQTPEGWERVDAA